MLFKYLVNIKKLQIKIYYVKNTPIKINKLIILKIFQKLLKK